MLHVRCCSFIQITVSSVFLCPAHAIAPNGAWVPSVPYPLCGFLHLGQCLVAGLDGCWDLLSSGSGLGGEFLRVPAGLLVHKPGISSPNEHVEEAEHLEEQHNYQGNMKKRHQNSGLETETKTLSEHCCSQSHDSQTTEGLEQQTFHHLFCYQVQNSRNSAVSKNCLKNPSLPSQGPSSHHRDVEGSQVGILRDLAGDVAPPAQSERGWDALGARGVLHVLQTLGPGGGTHQPEEDQARCDQEVLETSLSSARATKAADSTLQHRRYSQR